MHYFSEIDVGTYSSKGVLTDESGTVVSRAVTHHGMENPEPGRMSRTRIRYGGMIFAFCQKCSYSRVV